MCVSELDSESEQKKKLDQPTGKIAKDCNLEGNTTEKRRTQDGGGLATSRTPAALRAVIVLPGNFFIPFFPRVKRRTIKRRHLSEDTRRRMEGGRNRQSVKAGGRRKGGMKKL